MTIKPRDNTVLESLHLLFGGKDGWGMVRDLIVPPLLGSHRNQVPESAFVLPAARFGCPEDVPMIPLLRRVVDESLVAFSHFFPLVAGYAGTSPVSPHGSMDGSIKRWGAIDWDFVRDMDYRIYLPPQIGHESGFMTYLRQRLDRALRGVGLQPLLRGRDPAGRPQVQIVDRITGQVHGFHLFLLSMTPGFVNDSLHEGGGYSIHQTYFPENALDRFLQDDDVQWGGMVRRQAEQYLDMFEQVAFNTFGGDDRASLKIKTKGWYSSKAFKWHANLADLRGLESLTEELLGEYRSFTGSHEDLVHLVRHHYFALLDPAACEQGRLERELSFALSLAYARGRSPAKDPFVGRQASDIDTRVLVLEPVPTTWLSQALALIEGEGMDGPAMPAADRARIRALGADLRVRSADGVADACFHPLPDGATGLLIPSVWSFVLSEAYIHRASRFMRATGRLASRDSIEGALVAVTAGQLLRAVARPAA
jgi:hypothetical protein